MHLRAVRDPEHITSCDLFGLGTPEIELVRVVGAQIAVGRIVDPVLDNHGRAGPQRTEEDLAIAFARLGERATLVDGECGQEAQRSSATELPLPNALDALCIE